MTPDDLLDAARAIVRTQHPPQALADQMLARLASMPSPRHCDALRGGCVHIAGLLASRQSLLALLHSEDPELQDQLMSIAQPAAMALQSMTRRVKFQHRQRVVRRSYRDELCGEPPFRDHVHDALRVVDVSGESRPAFSGTRYGYAQVEPFTCARLSKPARASLYRRMLEARRLRGCDLWFPNEQALIGQWGVFAATAIPAGTCVGVYGGQVMDEHDLVLMDDDRYLMTSAYDPAQRASVSINGENLISLANTLLLLDSEGQVAGHPEDGYNIEVAKFPAVLSHGWHTAVPALFTIRDIAPGEELRWNYGLARLRHNSEGTTVTGIE